MTDSSAQPRPSPRCFANVHSIRQVRAIPTTSRPRCRSNDGVPRHQAEPKPIIDHRKAAGCEADALAVDAVDDVALGSCAVRQSRIRCDARSCLVELAPAERFQQVAGKDDTLPLTIPVLPKKCLAISVG